MPKWLQAKIALGLALWVLVGIGWAIWQVWKWLTGIIS